MAIRHEDGRPLSLKQVCDQAWDEFGVGAIVEELAARLAWNARYEGAERAPLITKDAASLLQIAERLKQWAAADAAEES
jgi:hypothetical protein